MARKLPWKFPWVIYQGLIYRKYCTFIFRSRKRSRLSRTPFGGMRAFLLALAQVGDHGHHGHLALVFQQGNLGAWQVVAEIHLRQRLQPAISSLRCSGGYAHEAKRNLQPATKSNPRLKRRSFCLSPLRLLAILLAKP